ncbi:unnamed protein product [Mytilus coruscus]|uniref:Uncharacterized protein n=1 Tax=Mytilus coruscus TaxID=42192 RepID=A0A6J8BYY3_MYTCO|nr:unnamed protein product [Mytilus coruscus]
MTTSNEVCSPPLLTGDIFTILHLLEHQTADWNLSARKGNYKLVIRWKKSKNVEHVETPTTTTKTRKRSSKARADRNKHRLQAFIARKSMPSINEKGNTAHKEDLDNDPDAVNTINTSELVETTTQPQDESNAKEQPAETFLADRNLPCTKPKDPTCLTGVEGRLTTTAGLENKIKTPRTHRPRVEKVTLDLPQQTYIFEVKKEENFILAYSDQLTPYKLVEKKKEPVFYREIMRSHEHWLDVRERKNFLFTEERKKHIEEAAKKFRFKLIE